MRKGETEYSRVQRIMRKTEYQMEKRRREDKRGYTGEERKEKNK